MRGCEVMTRDDLRVMVKGAWSSLSDLRSTLYAWLYGVKFQLTSEFTGFTGRPNNLTNSLTSATRHL